MFHKIYLTLLGVAAMSFIALGQVEIIDTSKTELTKDYLNTIVDLPTSQGETEEMLLNNRRLQTFMEYFTQEDIEFSAYDYLKLLSERFKDSNPEVHIGYVKFLLHDYSRYPTNRVRLVLSSEYIYNSENQIEKILIDTKRFEEE